MAKQSMPATAGHASYATQDDEMSLSAERAAADSSSLPDTLEVRSDALGVMQASMGRVQRPVMVALGAVAVVVGTLVAVGLMRRRPGGTGSV
ncbi:MAG: hypothetical protein Q7V58_10290 [Actinomycetota bacterium]|nr:hypothetical protein [Actinomycetota bacterium]